MQLPYLYEPFIDTTLNEFTLSEESSKHAAQVLRMKAGEQLQLTNGKGLLTTTEIIAPHKKNTVVRILSVENFAYHGKDICLAIAPTKNIGRIEWLLEKVTEIGIRKIILLQTKRTEKTNIKTERLHNILVSAMLQSRQVHLPELQINVSFDNIVKETTYKENYIAHCLDDKQKLDLKNIIASSQSKLMLIGPEGDFTEEEINLAIGKSFKPVSLGQTRLRTETAGLVAAVALTTPVNNDN